MKRKNGKRFKVFTAGIVTAAVALQSAFFIPGMKRADAAEAYIYGDMDNNGKLNVFDLCAMKRLYKSPEKMTDIQKEISDLDESSASDVNDIIMLTDYLLEKSTALQPEQSMNMKSLKNMTA